MTREEAKKLTAIVQAYADGKALQKRVRSDCGSSKWEWVDCGEVYEFQGGWDYRIKPEPRGWWLVIFGKPVAIFVANTLPAAVSYASSLPRDTGYQIVPVREVLE